MQKNEKINNLKCFLRDVRTTNNYGYIDFLDKKVPGKYHLLSMKRFDNYMIRFIYNYLKYQKQKKEEEYDFISVSFVIKENEDNPNIIDRDRSFIKNNYDTDDTIFNRVNTLKIILKNFENLEIKDRNISNKIKDIISIYYYIIILMPFQLGTAAIAEIFLYSLWKFYIKSSLTINQNIMLDIEALSNTFDIFYINCLNRDSEENNQNILTEIKEYNKNKYIPVDYTPYLFFL